LSNGFVDSSREDSEAAKIRMPISSPSSMVLCFSLAIVPAQYVYTSQKNGIFNQQAFGHDSVPAKVRLTAMKKNSSRNI
jgi:hypothetical protein